MSKISLLPGALLRLTRKYLIIFSLPIVCILVLNLIGIIPILYVFIVFFILIIVGGFADTSERKCLSVFTGLLSLLPYFIFTRFFVQELSHVYGDSMKPSVQDGDRVNVDKLIYQFSEPQKGDLIIFSNKLYSRKLGKIINLPGENIDTSIKISQNSYLVQINSSDKDSSSSFQGVEKSEIIGRVKSRFWPISRIGLIHPEK